MSFILNKKLTVYDYINYFILTCISVICIIPLLYVISISFTDPQVHIPLQFLVRRVFYFYSYVCARVDFSSHVTRRLS